MHTAGYLVYIRYDDDDIGDGFVKVTFVINRNKTWLDSNARGHGER